MTKQELSSIESDIEAQGYKRTVKVDATGKTTVTLTNRDGNSFAGQSTARGVSDRTKYEVALRQAYTRMGEFENRFA